MKHYIYSAILTIISAFLLWGCSDELLVPGNSNSPETNLNYYDGQGYELSVLVNDGSTRTRDVNFESGASLRINSLWVGVFDLKTGICVAKTDKNNMDMDFAPITSGIKKTSFVRALIDEPYKEYNESRNLSKGEDGYKDPEIDEERNPRDYIMVCVANFKDIYIYDTRSLTLLEDKLAGIEKWEEFDAIGVETASAYQYPHNSDAPILAGFLNDKDYESKNPSDTHIKIDQFTEKKDGGDFVTLSPATMINDLKIRYKAGEEGKPGYYYDVNSDKENEIGDIINVDKTIFLRRLVANINVNIHIENDKLTLTDVSYRRVNMPKAVYIIERKTTECDAEEGTYIDRDGEEKKRTVAKDSKGFPKSPDLSPNYADQDPQNLYYSDSDWIMSQNNDYFSFQQFANKHWAYYTPENQKSREKFVEGSKPGTDANGFPIYKFAALSDESVVNDFNNYASYFIIKMHLIDHDTGRALEAEYMIHHGNTSDELGNEASYIKIIGKSAVPGGELNDYSVARNVNYNYNVYIEGVNNIYHNVTVDGEHHNSQGGKIWRLIYVNDPKDPKTGEPIEPVAGKPDEDEENSYIKCHYDSETGDFINPVPSTGGTYEKGLIIRGGTGKVPDISFRLYGYNTESKHIEGYNYNFPQQSFTWLNQLWPPSAAQYSHYFKDYESLISNTGRDAIPKCLLDGLVIIDEDGKEFNIIGFVQSLHDVVLEKDKYYKIQILPTELNDLYPIIFDREKNQYVRAIFIADRNGEPDPIDGCTTLVNIYAAAQYPNYVHPDYQMLYVAEEEPTMWRDYNQIYENMIPYLPDYAYDINNTLKDENNNNKYDQGNENEMVFTDNPDLAFRIMGYYNPLNTGNEYYYTGTFVDICYNFDPADYPEFNGTWEAKTGATRIISNREELAKSIPGELLAELKLGNSSNKKTIVELLNEYDQGNNIKVTSFYPSTYGYIVADNPQNYYRALYVFDKKAFDSNYLIANDNSEVKYQIYGIRQLPRLDPRTFIPFDETSMIKHEDIYHILGNDYCLWCGGRNITTDLFWHHYEGITGYDVRIMAYMKETGAFDKPEEGQHFTITNIDEYLKPNPVNPSEKIIIYPFPTPGFSNTRTYNFIIKPIIDDKNYYLKSGDYQLELVNALQVYNSANSITWDFSQAPWTNLSLDLAQKTEKPFEYNGLIINHKRPTDRTNPKEDNYPASNKKYIQFGDKGESGSLFDAEDKTLMNNFSLYLHDKKGKLTINVGNTGNNPGRKLFLYVEKDNGGFEEVENWDINTSSTTGDNCDVELEHSERGSKRYYIVADNNCRFYKITYERVTAW